jgi:hypothetical protein
MRLDVYLYLKIYSGWGKLYPLTFSANVVTWSDTFLSFYLLTDCIKWKCNGENIFGLPASHIFEISNPILITAQFGVAVNLVWELLLSNLSLDTDYSGWDMFVIFLSPSRLLSGWYFDQATAASFQILCNSLFTEHVTIRFYIVSTITTSWNKHKDFD